MAIIKQLSDLGTYVLRLMAISLNLQVLFCSITFIHVIPEILLVALQSQAGMHKTPF